MSGMIAMARAYRKNVELRASAINSPGDASGAIKVELEQLVVIDLSISANPLNHDQFGAGLCKVGEGLFSRPPETFAGRMDPAAMSAVRGARRPKLRASLADDGDRGYVPLTQAIDHSIHDWPSQDVGQAERCFRQAFVPSCVGWSL